MLTYSLSELIDKLCIAHLKLWHIESEIEQIRDGVESVDELSKEQLERIDALLDQVVTLNKLRVDIVSSIDELFDNK
jgi:hypothetical protein